MVQLTETAVSKVKEILDTQEPKPAGLRISVVGGGCSGLSYKLDFDNEQQPKDQLFEDQGVKIVTDLKSFLYLCDTTLDFSDGLNGKGFHFINPNASRSCGCGESFAV